MRRVLASLTSFILFSTFLFPKDAIAEENIDRWVPEQQYNCPNWPRPGYMGFGVNYSENYLTPNYLLVAGNKAINTCESMTDQKCTDPDVYTISIGLTLPTCTSTIIINCLNKFEAAKRDGTKLEIKNLGEFKLFNEFNFAGSEEFGLPNPGSPTIYQIPDAPHPGGDKYIVVPYYGNILNTTEANRNLRNFNYNVAAQQVRIMIFAISIYDGKFEREVLKIIQQNILL
jgi:hypothetical protein